MLTKAKNDAASGRNPPFHEKELYIYHNMSVNKTVLQSLLHRRADPDHPMEVEIFVNGSIHCKQILICAPDSHHVQKVEVPLTLCISWSIER